MMMEEDNKKGRLWHFQLPRHVHPTTNNRTEAYTGLHIVGTLASVAAMTAVAGRSSPLTLRLQPVMGLEARQLGPCALGVD